MGRGCPCAQAAAERDLAWLHRGPRNPKVALEAAQVLVCPGGGQQVAWAWGLWMMLPLGSGHTCHFPPRTGPRRGDQSERTEPQPAQGHVHERHRVGAAELQVQGGVPGQCHQPCPQGLLQQQDPPAVSLQAAVRPSLQAVRARPAGGAGMETPTRASWHSACQRSPQQSWALESQCLEVVVGWDRRRPELTRALFPWGHLVPAPDSQSTQLRALGCLRPPPSLVLLVTAACAAMRQGSAYLCRATF